MGSIVSMVGCSHAGWQPPSGGTVCMVFGTGCSQLSASERTALAYDFFFFFYMHGKPIYVN